MTKNELISIADEISANLLEERFNQDFIPICEICIFNNGSKECRKVGCTKGVTKWIYDILAEYYEGEIEDDD